MSKKHFIALADAIRNSRTPFTEDQLMVLAAFCLDQNINFNRERWLAYIRGECGPNGGETKEITTL